MGSPECPLEVYFVTFNVRPVSIFNVFPHSSPVIWVLTSNWLRLHLIIVVVLLGGCHRKKGPGNAEESKGVTRVMDVRFKLGCERGEIMWGRVNGMRVCRFKVLK